MKAFTAIIKTILVFSVFLILLLALLLYLISPKHLDQDDYAAFVNRNSAGLTEIAEAALADTLSFSPIQSLLLARGKIDHVWPQENRVIFSIDLAYAPPEGHIYVIYQPDGEYVFPFDAPEWYSVETDDENTLRWEGGYMGGRGTVDVVRMSDCFFLEEAYLPT